MDAPIISLIGNKTPSELMSDENKRILVENVSSVITYIKMGVETITKLKSSTIAKINKLDIYYKKLNAILNIINIENLHTEDRKNFTTAIRMCYPLIELSSKIKYKPAEDTISKLISSLIKFDPYFFTNFFQDFINTFDPEDYNAVNVFKESWKNNSIAILQLITPFLQPNNERVINILCFELYIIDPNTKVKSKNSIEILDHFNALLKLYTTFPDIITIIYILLITIDIETTTRFRDEFLKPFIDNFKLSVLSPILFAIVYTLYPSIIFPYYQKFSDLFNININTYFINKSYTKITKDHLKAYIRQNIMEEIDYNLIQPSYISKCKLIIKVDFLFNLSKYFLPVNTDPIRIYTKNNVINHYMDEILHKKEVIVM